MRRLVWLRRGGLALGWAAFLTAVFARGSGGLLWALAAAGFAGFGAALAATFRLRSLAKRTGPLSRETEREEAARAHQAEEDELRAELEVRIARLLEKRPEDREISRLAQLGARKWAVYKGGTPAERAAVSWGPGEQEWGLAYFGAMKRVKTPAESEGAGPVVRVLVGAKADAPSAIRLAELQFDDGPPRAVKLDAAKLADAFRRARAAGEGEPRLWLAYAEVSGGR